VSANRTAADDAALYDSESADDLDSAKVVVEETIEANQGGSLTESEKRAAEELRFSRSSAQATIGDGTAVAGDRTSNA
jgi:hypothetical protein